MKELKIILATGAALWLQSATCQVQTGTGSDYTFMGGNTIISSTKTEKTIGSPYLTEYYMPVTVGGQNLSVRYNAHTDEIEYKNSKGELMNMMRDPNATVESADKQYRFILTDYIDNEGRSFTGYLNLISDNENVKVYQRITSTLTKQKDAANSYQTTRPPAYKRSPDQFYIKIKENPIVYLPSKKKEIVKMFPGKETSITDFLTQNKISLDKAEDMKKLGDFLNTL